MGGTSATLLCIDDDEDILELLECELSARGYRVVLASSGKDAQRQFPNVRPDLVLLDVMMPEVDGFEVARWIRSTGRELSRVPILFLTALGDSGTQDEAMREGGDDLLRKPIDPAELTTRVRALLSLARLRNEIRQCYATIRSQLDELEHARKQQQSFTESVVHDIRGPLTGIALALGDALQVLAADSPARDSLEDAQVLVGDLEQLTSDLLDLELGREGRLCPKRSQVDVGALIEAVCGRMRQRGEHRGVRLRVTRGGDLGTAQLDQSLIVRVLANLLDNALRHSPKDEVVDVTAQCVDEQVVIEVLDRGAGITAELRSRIFDKYVHEEGSISGRHGRGLGLAFCKVAVEAHGGTIEVAQSAKETTCFRVVLPKRDA